MISMYILSPGDFNLCARAASMSYGKDINDMTHEERVAYVMKIWDRHTNISEHFVQVFELQDVPRYVTMLIAMQRHGFSMTERSQRYRIPEETNQEYMDALNSGEKKEEARRCLSLMTPTDCVITMNREAARNVVKRLHSAVCENFFYTKELGDICRAISTSYKIGLVDDIDLMYADKIPNDSSVKEFLMPVYSFHQFIRHRTIEILSWNFVDESIKHISDAKNSDFVNVVAHSIFWGKFKNTRSSASTQEPLRSIAKELVI